MFDSPHSGSIYPDDFGHAIDRMILRRSEDAHVEELFSDVTDHGATLLHALFPRSYIDPNR
ncbi:MAG: N-formylglutamate amidohydrolase, partial [Yoonia sp.]